MSEPTIEFQLDRLNEAHKQLKQDFKNLQETYRYDIDRLTKERDQLAAKCASLRHVLEETKREHMGEVSIEWFIMRDKALSDQCGVGCLSPEKKKVLVEALEHIRNYPVHSEPVGGAYEMQDIASKALEVCK